MREGIMVFGMETEDKRNDMGGLLSYVAGLVYQEHLDDR
jgi:hypothetical protein